MLGLFFIYFIGKFFYVLAETYEKKRWGYAILGIVSYYVGVFLGAFALVFISGITGTNFIDDVDDFLVDLLCIPFGILAVFLLYIFLKRRWSRASIRESNIALDKDLLE